MSLCLIDGKKGDALHTVIPEAYPVEHGTSFIGDLCHAKNRFLLREYRNDRAMWLHFSKWRKLMGNQVNF